MINNNHQNKLNSAAVPGVLEVKRDRHVGTEMFPHRSLCLRNLCRKIRQDAPQVESTQQVWSLTDLRTYSLVIKAVRARGAVNQL